MTGSIATAWAVVDGDGEICVNTISQTRRAAIVNWLCVSGGLMATYLTDDETIERAWDGLKGKAEAETITVGRLSARRAK